MRRLVVLVLAALCMAPTVGDVGGCGSEATELDSEGYSFARKEEDCTRCRACGIATARCGRASDPAAPQDVDLPSTCRPVVHDEVVCLRALHAASCEAFASYVDDFAPATPSECEFCKIAGGDR